MASIKGTVAKLFNGITMLRNLSTLNKLSPLLTSITLALALFAIPSSASAQEFAGDFNSKSVSSFKTDNLAVQLLSSPGNYKLTLTPSGNDTGIPVADARVFWLKQPSRLVVDVMDFSSSSAYKEEVRNVDIAAIRTGIHKEKVRVVIDIREELVPDYKSGFDASTGGFFVDFSFSGRKSASVDSQTKPKPEELTQLGKKPREIITRRPEPVPSADEISMIIKEDTPKIKRPKQIIPPAGVVEVPKPRKAKPPKTATKSTPIKIKEEPKAVKKPAPKKATSSSILAAIEFRELLGQESSALFIDINNPANFSLEKKDSSVYELTLEKTKLKGVNLSLPQFPPDAFEGFEVVVCRQRGEDVVVRIYTPEGTTLTPFRAQGKLWVKAK